jgi:hypothetical protein
VRVRVWVGIALAVVFVVALVLATLRESQVSCEVCVVFGGQEACRTAVAADRDQALAMAQNTACAVLARGVTPGMQCNRTQPHRAVCEGD